MKYRLHSLDDAQQIVSSKDLVAQDDLAALDEAEKVCQAYAMEIWQGARCVARVKKDNAPLDATDRMSL